MFLRNSFNQGYRIITQTINDRLFYDDQIKKTNSI